LANVGDLGPEPGNLTGETNDSLTQPLPSRRAGLQKAASRTRPRQVNPTCPARCPVRHEIETEPLWSDIYFGATWTRLFVGHPISSVPISRVTCSKCPGGSPAEYVAWGDTNAPEADRREASALLAELVEKDHPRHNAVYSGMTLEELRQRVGRKASSAGS